MLSRAGAVAHHSRFRVIFGTAISGAAVIAAALAGPIASASAATTIGQTFTPLNNCGAATFVQSSSPGNAYAAPVAGVITSWRYQAASPAPAQVKLKVARANGGNDFTIVGESELQTPTENTVNSYPVRLPVQGGEVLGIYQTGDGAGGSAPCAITPASPGYFIHGIIGSDVPPGPTMTYEGALSAQLPVAASLEPDCDGDGLGDESQDADVSSCAPTNEFSFGKAKRNKRRGTAKLTVNVPGPGELELAKTRKVKADDEPVEAAGEETLRVKPKGKAKKKLNKGGKAKVKAKVTYTPDGGAPNTERKRVKLGLAHK
ncbi:MAG: hypothetical protein ACRDQW_17435 [Haloechinothrix sp.]